MPRQDRTVSIELSDCPRLTAESTDTWQVHPCASWQLNCFLLIVALPRSNAHSEFDISLHSSFHLAAPAWHLRSSTTIPPSVHHRPGRIVTIGRGDITFGTMGSPGSTFYTLSKPVVLSPKARAKNSGSVFYTVGFTFLLCVVLMIGGTMMLLLRDGRIPAESNGPAHRPWKPFNNVQLTRRQLQQEVNKQHPINRLQCGNWISEYSTLHKAIVSGQAPQRYAVMRSKQEFGNGLADRLATSVTIFMYALLTDRAFLYDWDPPPEGSEEQKELQKKEYGKYMFFEPPSHLWRALRSDYIDWRYAGQDRNLSSTVMDYNCDKDTDIYKAMFAQHDITQFHRDVDSIVWHADHAMVYSAFDNPHLRPKLEALGLQRETAFSCMFDFLYRPTQPVLELFKDELQVLVDPNILKIGVQIRVGDWQLCDNYLFKPQHYPSLFDHYFQCAAEIEHELAQPGQPVVWYTLTDIPTLRQGLARRHAGHILINANVQVEHIVKTKNGTEQGFLQAAGELWLFSLTSAHVITRKSGFGKVPAMVNANGTQHIFSVDYPMVFMGRVGLDNRKNLGWYKRETCSSQHATPLSLVCNDFTGI